MGHSLTRTPYPPLLPTPIPTLLPQLLSNYPLSLPPTFITLAYSDSSTTYPLTSPTILIYSTLPLCFLPDPNHIQPTLHLLITTMTSPPFIHPINSTPPTLHPDPTLPTLSHNPHIAFTLHSQNLTHPHLPIPNSSCTCYQPTHSHSLHSTDPTL